MADGAYPRLNAEMVGSGHFDGQMVSLVGQMQTKHLAESRVEFKCCDGGIISMDISSFEEPENLGDVVEAIGQLDNGSLLLFVTRHLSSDTSMELYNKMLQVQHNPKYASYFSPFLGGAMAGQ